MFYSQFTYRNIATLIVIIGVLLLFFDYQRKVKQQAAAQAIQQIEQQALQQAKKDEENVREIFEAPVNDAITDRVDRLLDQTSKACCPNQLPSTASDTTNADRRNTRNTIVGTPHQLFPDEIEALENAGLLSCDAVICR